MQYQLIRPSPVLQPYIQFYGLLQKDESDLAPMKDIVAPYLGKGLIFNLGENSPVWVSNHNFHVQAPSGYFLPQCTQPFCIHIADRIQMLAIVFRPGQFRRFFRLPAKELVDFQVLTFEAVGLLPLMILQEQLQEPISIASKLQLVEAFLFRQLDNIPFRFTLTDEALSILHQYTTLSLNKLTNHLGVSARYLRKIFTQEIGISPKNFIRIRRFNLAFQMLKSGHYSKLSDIAYELDYFDQSHFILEFKQFIGTTPLQFLKERHPLQNQLYWQ